MPTIGSRHYFHHTDEETGAQACLKTCLKLQVGCRGTRRPTWVCQTPKATCSWGFEVDCIKVKNRSTLCPSGCFFMPGDKMANCLPQANREQQQAICQARRAQFVQLWAVPGHCPLRHDRYVTMSGRQASLRTQEGAYSGCDWCRVSQQHYDTTELDNCLVRGLSCYFRVFRIYSSNSSSSPSSSCDIKIFSDIAKYPLVYSPNQSDL